MDVIVTTPKQIGADLYLPADLIDLEACYKQGTLNERTVELMTRQSAVAVATKETFGVAAARRPAGSPWPPRGFTEAYLIEAGLIDPAPVKAEAKKPMPPKLGEVITHVKLTNEKVAVGEFFVQPKKSGNFTLFDAVTAEGELLRPKAFKKQEQATAFLDALSTATPPPVSPGTQEKPDDGDVRHEPEHPQGQDSSEDR